MGSGCSGHGSAPVLDVLVAILRQFCASSVIELDASGRVDRARECGRREQNLHCVLSMLHLPVT